MTSSHSLLRRFSAALGAACAALVAASSAFGQYPPANPTGYRVIPAPESTTAFLGSARSFNWVDNDQLLFLANDRELSTTKKDKERTVVIKAVPTIHLWDFRSATIRRYQPEPLADWLCAADGWVRYGLERNGEKVVYEGRFGKEKPRAGTPARVGKDGKPVLPLLNRFSCREYWFAEVPRRNGGLSFPPRTDDGVFERLGSDIKGRPQWEGSLPPFKGWIHKESASVEITLPQELMSHPLAYSSLANGYLFRRVQGRIEKGVSNRLYKLEVPSYLVRSLDILGNQNWAILSRYTVVRRGLLAASDVPSDTVKRDPASAGVYLFYGAPVFEFLGKDFAGERGRDALPFISYERITRGFVAESSAASPDGCRVAVVTDANDENRRIWLDVVDFCKTGP